MQAIPFVLQVRIQVTDEILKLNPCGRLCETMVAAGH